MTEVYKIMHDVDEVDIIHMSSLAGFKKGLDQFLEIIGISWY